VTPEAAEGGPIGLLEDGDTITIDAVNNRMDVDLSESQLDERRARWQKPAPKYRRGALAKYAKTVTSASDGAVTDMPE